MNELQIMRGKPIEVKKGLKVYPVTLGEIADIGEETYNSYLQSFLINKSILKDIGKELSPEQLRDLYQLTDYDFIIYLCVQNNDLLSNFLEALKLFLKKEVTIEEEIGIIIEVDDGLIELDSELFTKIKQVILKQNFLKDVEETNYNPANDKAKALIQKMKEVKDKLKKQNSNEGLSLKTIISLVAAYSHDLNIISVWDLTVNQLYENYLRIILWDDYHNKMILLPHSSSDQDLDLKHWAIDINKIN